MRKPKTPKEFENLGRTVAAIYETGYLDKKTALKTSFLKGMASGFGGVIGATIIAALLIWVLSLFGQVPLIGHFVDTVKTTINQ